MTIAAGLFKPVLPATRRQWHFEAACGHQFAPFEAIITGMFVLLSSTWRRRAAALVAVLYTLCVMVPGAAFALSTPIVPAHCLTMADPHQAGAGHSDHGASHSSMDNADHAGMSHEENGNLPASGEELPGKCCGLFSVMAIAPKLGLATEPSRHFSEMALPAFSSLTDRGASRIDRPPRALPSL